MSNLIINIRVLDLHFQVARDTPWVKFLINNVHRRENWPDGWFSVYQFFGYTREL